MSLSLDTFQGVDIVLPRLGLPDRTVTLVVWLCVMGFPAAIVLAWALERTPEGLRLADDVRPAIAVLPFMDSPGLSPGSSG
jgi:hypothetical protein